MADIFIGLGSNLGNRKKNIEKAIKKMAEHIQIIKVSPLYKTTPQEGVSGNWFFNGVIYGKTSLTPMKLLKFLQSIEEDLGRPINHKKNTARTIDLDILFYGNKIIKNKTLTIPHPKILEREFVIHGLSEVNKRFVHPLIKKTMAQIWKEFNNAGTQNKKRSSYSNRKSKDI
ncbi:MAG TPA: 2-amino-4-hydroxy-6-hydroxymethyldihydropteridine diphosphokinase, partial [Candidatus Ratteibacteria bacterium]|nr:2-amino-4-hydroxy-6-hydroxymethyldihydropteridine diphosphokinase [Candidatus Ratteibacteria bacterium]